MGESFSKSEGQPARSLLDTHGNVLITYKGETLPLIVWLGFCESNKPIEEWDPAEVNRIAQDFLDGKDPFAKYHTRD